MFQKATGTVFYPSAHNINSAWLFTGGPYHEIWYWDTLLVEGRRRQTGWPVS